LSLSQVIKGWQEVVPLMNVGSKYQVYIPAELAYGEKGAGHSIEPNETLIFDIELISIN
jgi:FKBP-type peptidyl-prolyl cis-trans isomerase FklB